VHAFTLIALIEFQAALQSTFQQRVAEPSVHRPAPLGTVSEEGTTPGEGA
jgi:hypothetical protein